MGDLDSLVAESKTKISALISKPKMAEKLLSKPPFRFLHDLISAITTTTGFAEGLYTPEELDSGTIGEKNAKMAYLDKIFRLVGICQGAPLEVKSLKVVQGLEAELTNIFLIALADCAGNPIFDNEEAVRRCLAGEEPGQRPPPLKQKGGGPPPVVAPAESKSSSDLPVATSGAKSSFPDDRKPLASDSKDMDEKINIDTIAPERGKSRGGTRGGKPNQATGDVGLGGFTSANIPNLDGEIMKCDGTEAMTHQLLGTLISRPKLTDKLLGKPPFRFLFDIVMEVIRATGFGAGLYSDFESDSANVSDKTQKMNFLEKIIRLVGVQLGTLVDAKPARIVAGLDPQLTNNFLQLLAVAARNMPDSRKAVQTVLDMGDSNAEMKGEITPPAETSRQQPIQPAQVQQPVVADSRQTNNVMMAPAEQKDNSNMGSRLDDRREVYPVADDKTSEAMGGVGEGEGGSDAKRSARPSTARRRPPKVKDAANELQSKDVAPVGKKAEGIIIDGAEVDEDMDGVPDETNTRLADDLRSDGKSDRSAPAQSKLVQDIMSRQAEQEAATRNRVEITEETKGNEGNAQGGSGIRLTRMKKSGSEKKTTSGVAGSLTPSFGETDLEKMRSSIQALVQQTGPMGVCMDFIQEDISLMTAELHKWEEDCNRYENLYEDAKRKTKESLHPLKLELTDLEDQIAECISKISQAKASNAKNDEKIQQMLKLIATA